MNILEAMERVDRSVDTYIDLGMLGDVLRLSDLHELCQLELEFKAYWLFDFSDGYNRVGSRVYDFRGEPVAYSFVSYSGQAETIEWVSEEAYHEVRRYFMELWMLKSSDWYKPTLLDIGENFTEDVRLEYALETTHKQYAYLEGERVRIIDRFVSLNNDSRVVVQYDDGERETVEVRELEFRLNIE